MYIEIISRGAAFDIRKGGGGEGNSVAWEGLGHEYVGFALWNKDQYDP